MGMSTSDEGSDAPLSEINVTPLVDVMLVLLIVFMVAAPLLTTGVEVELPSAEAARLETDDAPVILSVQRDERVFLGDEEIAVDALEAWLRERELEEVLVQADTAVPYGAVVRVLAVVRRAGIGRMGLVTDPVDWAGR